MTEENPCGSCTACCTVLKIEEPLNKPAMEPCKHLCDKGCGIYADRPKVCQTFECLWLASQGFRDPDTRFPKVMRPDACGLMLRLVAKDGSERVESLDDEAAILINEIRPGAFHTEPAQRVLVTLLRAFPQIPALCITWEQKFYTATAREVEVSPND